MCSTHLLSFTNYKRDEAGTLTFLYPNTLGPEMTDSSRKTAFMLYCLLTFPSFAFCNINEENTEF